MEQVDGEGVGQGLGAGPVRDAGEGIVQVLEDDASLLELGGQPVVAVALEVETEGHPSGHPQIAQAKLGIEEVEAVVEAFPVLVPLRGLPGGLIVTRSEGWAGLHGREDVDQDGVTALLLDNRSNAIFLAEGSDPANELDLKAVLAGNPLGVLADLVAQQFSEARM